MRYLIIYIISIASCIQLSGQSLEITGVDVATSITEDEKNQIIQILEQKWGAYVSAAALTSEADRDQLLDLFALDAQHYVDFKETPIDMKLSIDDYVSETKARFASGLVFDIETAELVQIGVDESFNFFAEIEFIKRFNEFLNLDREMKFRTGGLSSKQQMRFTIDPYEIEKAYIYSIQGRYVDPPALIASDTGDSPGPGKKTKKKREKVVKTSYSGPLFKDVESMFSATLGASFGGGSLAFSDDIMTSDILDAERQPVRADYVGLPGLDLTYRRSLGEKQKLYLNLGLGIELGRIKTDISNFSHQDTVGFIDRTTQIGYSARSGQGFDNQGVVIFPYNGSDNDASIYILGNEDTFESSDSSNIIGGFENNSVYLFSFRPGLSFKIYESGSSLSSLFLDVNGEINYVTGAGSNSLSYSGTINSKAALKLPTDFFPIKYVLDNLDDFNIQSAYQLNRVDVSTIISKQRGISGSNLFFGASAGLTFQRKINYGFGFELSGGYHFGLTPLYKQSDEAIGFLEGENNPRESSIIEQYYPSTMINRISLRAGLFFLLNQE